MFFSVFSSREATNKNLVFLVEKTTAFYTSIFVFYITILWFWMKKVAPTLTNLICNGLVKIPFPNARDWDQTVVLLVA